MLRWVRPAKPKFGVLEAYGLIGLGALLTARFVPIARYWPFWGCTLRKHTGIPCVSCGMTRSFDWFMQGRLFDSLAINPIGFLLAILSLVAGAYLVLYPWRPPRPKVELPPGSGKWVRIGAVAAVAANWAYVLVRYGPWHA